MSRGEYLLSLVVVLVVGIIMLANAPDPNVVHRSPAVGPLVEEVCVNTVCK
jgi:hypothetical protein